MQKLGLSATVSARAFIMRFPTDALLAQAGISPGYLSMLVNEGRAPSGRIRRRIQEALSIEDFHQLFSFTANLPPPDQIAEEIVEDLCAALEQLEEIAEDLSSGPALVD